MDKECKRIQEHLTDAFYQEKLIDKGIQLHIGSCEECRSHQEFLHSLGQEISMPDTGADADMQAIRQAFKTAECREKKRKERIDFAIFLVLVFSLMSIVVGIEAFGYGMAVIIGQLSIAALTSLLIPLMFVKKLEGEDA